ncbi:MAG TPA: P1 family peptidase [Candidatus Angelobacter sp.]|nr:P1 family peptidase [Candidatus Angelobacter sp.]
MTRKRLRDLGHTVGQLPPGPNNAITDVAGVRVGHATVVADQPRLARTGITVLVPNDGLIWDRCLFAGAHVFNGFGEMTGLAWLNEAGLLNAPIALTNTHDVGAVRDALVTAAHDRGHRHNHMLPIAAETCDEGFSDATAHHVSARHLFEALDSASGGAVAEGNVGGGTGMVCHDFKGGTGTASRIGRAAGQDFTVGALVQANYGSRADLRVDGVPVGREIGFDRVPVPDWQGAKGAGSIIVVLATDLPLLPLQCRRLAQRAGLGLARVGGVGHNGSGDIFIAFSTGNILPLGSAAVLTGLRMLPNEEIDPLFEAAIEAVEESILNALAMAETMTGLQGRTVHALPYDLLAEAMARYRRRD